MNEEIKDIHMEPEVTAEVQGNEDSSKEEEKKSHITFEIIKGKENEHKFYFAIPKNVSLGVAYDAAFELINHITKTITETTKSLAPKKEEEKQPEGDEK